MADDDGDADYGGSNRPLRGGKATLFEGDLPPSADQDSTEAEVAQESVFDQNQDGAITPVDLLRVVNALHHGDDASDNPAVDVHRDNVLSEDDDRLASAALIEAAALDDLAGDVNNHAAPDEDVFLLATAELDAVWTEPTLLDDRQTRVPPR